MFQDPVIRNISKRHPVIATPAMRPVALTVLIAATLIIGSIALSRIELALIPPGLESRSLSVDFDIRNRGTSWSPQEVQDRITLVVEGELLTVPGIDSLRSTSSRDEAEFDISFSGTTDLADAYAQVRDRIERARLKIGDLIDQPRIRRFSLSDEPMAAMSIIWSPDVENPWDKLNNRIKPVVESAEGISTMDAWGEMTPYFRVALDRRKMASLTDVGVRELIEQLQSDNFSTPAGKVSGDERDSFVVVDSRFESLEQLRNFPVTPTLRLSDVAEVTESNSASSYVFNHAWDPELGGYEHGRGVYARISKTSDSSIVKAGAAFAAAVEQLQNDPYLKGFQFKIASNQGDDIVAQLKILQETLLIGGALAVLVLMLFLKRFRLALIIALSIPLSMTMALVTMYFAGEYLSMLALMGFTVAAGMLLDNAIVVSENIYRRLPLDNHSFAAAVRGASEVGLALALATSTTVVVFLSVAFFNDSEVGRFMMARLGFPIVFSLGFSILVALAIIPATMHRVFRRGGSDVGIRGWWHRTHFRMSASPATRWLAALLGVVFGRSPDVPAGTRIGEYLDHGRNGRLAWIGVGALGIASGVAVGWAVFHSLGGTDFFGPVIDKISAFFEKMASDAASSGTRGGGGRGGPPGMGFGGAPKASVFPTFASLGCGFLTALIPIAVMWLLPRRQEANEPAPLLARASSLYGRLIAGILRHPVLILCYATVGLGLLIGFGIMFTEFTQANSGAQRGLFFRIQFPDNVRATDNEPNLTGGWDSIPRDWQYLFKTREALFGIPFGPRPDPSDTAAMEKARRLQQEAFDKFGISRGALTIRPGGMMVFMSLDDSRAGNARETEESIKKALPVFAGFTVSGGFGSNQANQIRINLSGPDYGYLRQVATDVTQQLATLPSLTNVSDGTEELAGYAEASMFLDFSRAMSLGVNPQTFARIVAFQINGSRANDFMRGEQTRSIRIVYDYAQDRAGRERATTLEDVMRVPIPRTDGTSPVESLIQPKLDVVGGSDQITRLNGQSSASISATIRGSSTEATAQIQEVLNSMNLPPDRVVADITSGFDSSRGRRGRGRGGPESPLTAESLLAALLLITIVMAFLFESITRPLVVLLACIPGAIAGAFWALVMTDTMFDALCGLGVVVLLGVAVNNGIVFVDLINRLRAEGVALNSAIRMAGEQRLRPMLMTSLTTIAGLVPMAVSTSAFFDMPYYPLARTILGGMILSTLVTLIAVPVWYGVIENSREYVGTLLGALLRRGKST